MVPFRMKTRRIGFRSHLDEHLFFIAIKDQNHGSRVNMDKKNDLQNTQLCTFVEIKTA